MVKRQGKLKQILVSDDTIREAVRLATKGRKRTREYYDFDAHRKERISAIKTMLEEGTYRSSPYRFFDRTEGHKVRHIAALPLYPDRIVHWALVLTTQDVFLRNYHGRTYATIPGKGTHLALRQVTAAIREPCHTYYLKMDVHHYFENIDKDILMAQVTRRIKDPCILALYREIIYGYPRPGIPIGNLTSQYLANLYLSDLDHFLAEQYHATAFRYMDDILVLGYDKTWLRRVRTVVETRLKELGLDLNPNWRIAPVSSGVDFVGYRIWPDYTLLRTRTKRKLVRKMKRLSRDLKNGAEPTDSIRGCVAAYHGILSWCDGHRLHRQYIDPVIAQLEAYQCRQSA